MELLFSLLLIPVAWLVDSVLGEPTRFHPLVAFGKYAKYIEKRVRSTSGARSQGVLALLISLLPTLPFIFAAYYLQSFFYYFIALLIVYFAMAHRSLREHALEVYTALDNGDLPAARYALSKIVSRNTAELNETEISSACIESVLENGSDAIFAPWFWWLLAAIPGVLIYRLVNTLDAMWGYKNERYRYFGWAAARTDDVMNYLPARTTAFCYCLAGNWRIGWRCWREQGRHWKSPNAGPVMAAGAGSLEIQLGGAANYHGKTEQRPVLGTGRQPEKKDILTTLTLLHRAMWIWLIFAAALFSLYAGVLAL